MKDQNQLERVITRIGSDDKTISPSTETSREVGSGWFQGSLGLLLLIGSAVFFSCASLCVKLVHKRGVHSLLIILSRGIQQCIIALALCLFYKINPFGNRGIRRYLWFRGIVGSLALGIFYFSITQLPLGDANAIFFTCPFFGTIIAWLWLGEVVPLHMLLIGCSSFVGVLLIAKPGFNSYDQHGTLSRPVASLICLGGAALAGLALVSIRRIGHAAHDFVLVFYFAFANCLIFVPAALIFVRGNYWSVLGSLSFGSWMLILGVGLPASFAQVLLNRGMKLEKAGVGSFMRNLDIAFAYLYQVTILSEPLEVLSIIGAAVIVSSSGVVLFLRYYQRNPETKNNEICDESGDNQKQNDVESEQGQDDPKSFDVSYLI